MVIKSPQTLRVVIVILNVCLCMSNIFVYKTNLCHRLMLLWRNIACVENLETTSSVSNYCRVNKWPLIKRSIVCSSLCWTSWLTYRFSQDVNQQLGAPREQQLSHCSLPCHLNPFPPSFHPDLVDSILTGSPGGQKFAF